MGMSNLQKVKVLLGIKDELQDEVLEIIESLTLSHFKAYTSQTQVPNELNYIIIEVMIKRFNRIGSEGYTSKGIEGLSLTFNQSDLNEYAKILKQYFPTTFGGGVKFI